MKQIILLVGILLFGINAKASHILGGFIGVAQTNIDSTTVVLNLLVDGQSPVIPTVLYVERWEKNSVGWYLQNGVIELTAAHVPFNYQGQKLISYTSGYLDLDSNQYRFIYRNCCWGILNNSTNSTNANFTIGTDYWHIPYNSTPLMINPLIYNLQVGIGNTMKPLWGNFNCHFTNTDPFDLVEIEDYDLIYGYANGTYVPQIYSSLSNHHVSNDSISWAPSTIGKYGIGYKITERRNGQVIGRQVFQWTYNVVSSTLDIVENDKPIVYDVYDWLGNHIYHGENIPYYTMNGLYILKFNNTFEKIFVN
jgi:hypothetical protein